MTPLRRAAMRILGRDWKVAAISDEARTLNVPCPYGTCSYAELTLFLRPGVTGEVTLSTLLHETIHAIDMIQDAGLTEHQIELLEAGLYAVLSDNGADLEWLAAPLKKAKLLREVRP